MFVLDLMQLGVETGIITKGGSGNNVFVSSKARIPDGDGPYTSLNPTAGLTGLRVHNRKFKPAYERPGAQIVVRAKDPMTAFNKAQEWFNEIGKVRNRFLNGYWYQDILIQQNPFDGGLDDPGRLRVIFNVIATKRPDIIA